MSRVVLSGDRTTEWQSIRMPCLVLVFEHDVDSPFQRAREAAAVIPGAPYAEIPDASQLGSFTHPVPVVDFLIDFLATALDSSRPEK